MQLLLNKSDLDKQFRIPEFVLKTQKQISKDFATVGEFFSEDFEKEQLPYDSLIDIVQTHLVEVMKVGETNLLQLLYQIDLPQQDFLSIVTDADFSEKMADLIIRREAYKVYLRSKF